MENNEAVEIKPEAPSKASEIEVLRDYSLNNESPVILVNPAHGNEPYIMGTAFAQDVGRKLAEKGIKRPKVVVPLLYGDRQKRILLEENPQDAELIHFDEKFGEILKDITFGNGDFSQHLRQVNAHYDETERLLRSRFSGSEDFDVKSLTTDESLRLSPKNIIATIDTAPRVTFEAPLRYFAFPILVSEILKEANSEGLGFSESDLSKLINRMIKAEAGYSQVFIPYINPMSYRNADDLLEGSDIKSDEKVTHTPAMKRELEKTTGKVDEPGVYVMFSGTGSNQAVIHDLAKSASEMGLKIYSPPWVEVEGSTPVSPDVLNDENILAVFGRSGWGTGWQVQNLARPWFVTPYQEGDDPEIYFNNKTVEALGMGKVLADGDLTPQKLETSIKKFSIGAQRINEVVRDKFGTLDGIDFVSSAIVEDFFNKTKTS